VALESLSRLSAGIDPAGAGRRYRQRPVTLTRTRTFLACLLLAAAALACIAWPERASFDPAPLLEAAARYEVRILRDEWGVPHIYGKRDADVAYGLAYAHSEDDFETIQKVLAAARGELARIDGVDAAPIDYLVQWFGVWDWIDERYEHDVPDDVQALVDGYAAGVNHYAALHPQQVYPGLMPVTGQDVVAGFAFKMPLFYGLQSTLAELFGDERAQSTSAPPLARRNPQGGKLASADSAMQRALRFWTRGAQLGSNAVAVGPGRSADGATRLLINSHQPYVGPVSWYEVRLLSEEGWDMAGGVFPGAPVVLHGHNRHLGWASTVNQPDLADVYVLETDADGERYRFGDGWRAFERSEARFTVRLWGRLRWPVTREVLRSEHGPAIATPHGTYALRFAGMGELRQLEQFYRLNRATTLDEWLAAMRLGALPSLNYVYADREGHIGYFYNARFPKRTPGWDWKKYLPGDRPELIWRESWNFDETPHVIDPPSGYVVSANHTPFAVTAEGEGPDPADFPAELGIESQMTNRSLRLLELYGGDDSITREEFHAYKYDKRYSTRAPVRAIVREILAADFGGDDDLRAGQALLAKWSFDTELDNRVTALGVMSALPIVLAQLRGLPATPDPRDTFRAAVATLLEHHGRLDPLWGDVNRFRRGSLDLPANGGPDVLRALEDFEPEPDGTFAPHTGDSFVMFVEWDRDGKIRSESVHQYGSATLDKETPHYADQVELFLAQRTKPVLLDEAELRKHLEREYRPGDE
jgi:penicillin amidase/acyl-homoserine-lactone acylase